MRVDRRPVLAALAMAVILSVAACVDTFEPTGPDTRPDAESETEEQQQDEGGGELRAGYGYSGGMLVGLPS